MAKSDGSDTSAEELKAVKDDLKELRADFQDLLSALKGEGGEKLSDLRDRVKASARDKAAAARDRADDMRDGLHESTERAREVLGDRPFTTAVGALCLGLITGVILGGRR
jgi:ElaB/YqjD/DUF883 family membrane-anchored ribosome-binding protein